MKFHRDGRAFIADYKRGLLALNPKTGKVEEVLGTAFSESFKGLNDLHFADNGDLYFTDQGQSGIADPTGRVWRLRANGELQRLVANAPSPNGIALNKKNSQVYVAITRAQQIWRLPLMAGARLPRPASPSSSRAAMPGPTASSSTTRMGCSSAIWAWASGASTPTACPRISPWQERRPA